MMKNLRKVIKNCSWTFNSSFQFNPPPDETTKWIYMIVEHSLATAYFFFLVASNITCIVQSQNENSLREAAANLKGTQKLQKKTEFNCQASK